jgi:TPR repeat protein
MRVASLRRAFALAILLAVGAPSGAKAQVTEMEKLEAAKKAYEGQDYDRAFYLWFGLCQAANRGSCYNLGLMYASGRGAPVDLVEAYKWMHLAAEDGLPEAISARARLAASLSATQIKTAMDRAEDWKRDNGW